MNSLSLFLVFGLYVIFIVGVILVSEWKDSVRENFEADIENNYIDPLIEDCILEEADKMIGESFHMTQFSNELRDSKLYNWNYNTFDNSMNRVI
ncbi:MAG TPA: hypothetical protein V6C58_17710 [Allocoleopsis sp.]